MRPSKLLAAVLVAVGLGLLALLWVGRSTDVRQDAPPASVNTAGVESAMLPAIGSEPGPATLPHEAATAAQRTQLGAPAIPADSCRIRVVEAGSREPVPAARVWIQRADVRFDAPEWSRAMRRFNDVEPVLQSGLGDEFALDAEATLVVPRPKRALVLAAASGNLHGEAMLEPDAVECLVELEPYHALTIEVVDRSRQPVPGALVALYWGDFDPLAGDETWIADTDGRVWIPKLEQQLWPEGYRGPVRVSLAAGVPSEPEIVLFTTETVPAEPVRLVAGDFGRIVVQLVDAQGTALALEGRANLQRMEEASQATSLSARAGNYVDAMLTEGRAVFASVGLGLDFDVMLVANGHQSVWREFAGPTQAGQELHLTLPIGIRMARAQGRVLDIGASFGGVRPAWATLTGHPLGSIHGFTTSVREGELFDRQMVRATEVAGLDRPWLLELVTAGRGRVRARVVPTLDEAAGVVDFGDLRFEPAPALAHVRVLDPAGAAVRASLELESPAGKELEQTDDEGRMLLAGSPADLPQRVRATHWEWLPSDWTRIDAAGSEATLVLRQGATLEGSALLPKGAPLDAFELVLRIEPSTRGAEAPEREEEFVEGARFRFQRCEPGRARLVVIYENHVLFESDGIELVAGETTRLEPIDLAARLHPLALTIELASGEPWSGGHLELRELDGTLSTWTDIGPSGRASLLALRPSVDAWVAGRGARAQLFEGVRDGDRLVLTPAPSIRLRLPVGLQRPAAPFTLRVYATPTEDVEFETYDDVDIPEALVGEDGTTWLRLSRPGTYGLEWVLRHEITGEETDVQQAELQTIVVPDAEAPAEIEAALTREELASAVLEARR